MNSVAPALALPHRAAAPSVIRPAIAYAVFFGSVGAYFPYISVFYRQSGLSLESIGMLGALFAAVGLVAAPAWGALADWSRDLRRPIVLAGLLSGAAALWLALAREPIAIALAVALLAAGAVGLGPMLDSLTIERLGERRERFGRARAWGSAAFIVVSIVTGTLVGGRGAVALFLVFVPGLLLTAVVAAVLFRGSATRRRTVTVSIRAGLAGILRHPTLSLFLIGSIVLWSSVSAVTTFVSIHLVALHASGEIVGLVWALGALVEVPLMFAFPVLARRFGNERLLVIGALGFSLRALAWALAPTPLLLVATAPLGGIGFGLFYVGTVGYVARAVPADVQATAQGVFSGTAFATGSIIGALLGGQLAAAMGIPGLFIVAAAAALTAAGIIWWAIAAAGGPGRASRPIPSPAD